MNYFGSRVDTSTQMDHTPYDPNIKIEEQELKSAVRKPKYIYKTKKLNLNQQMSDWESPYFKNHKSSSSSTPGVGFGRTSNSWIQNYLSKVDEKQKEFRPIKIVQH